jgi:hypothetical protein
VNRNHVRAPPQIGAKQLIFRPMDSIELFSNKLAFKIRRALAAYWSPSIVAIGAIVLFALAIAFQMAGNTRLQTARSETRGMSQRGKPAVTLKDEVAQVRVDLKAFRSSHLLAIIEQGASTANIKIDEISFAVDDSPNQPYVRYRASFTVLSRYPAIRKFISEILAGSEGVVLDTVACRREDVTAADVRCDISAYVAYQEKAGG